LFKIDSPARAELLVKDIENIFTNENDYLYVIEDKIPHVTHGNIILPSMTEPDKMMVAQKLSSISILRLH
jgi:hypothetical protein